MKKTCIVFLSLALCLCLCACTGIDLDMAGGDMAGGNTAAAVVGTAPADMLAPTMAMPTEPVEETAPTTEPVGEEEQPSQSVQGGINVEVNDTPAAGCNHSFSEATCQKPATCSLCGVTKGEPGEHNFTKSGCSVCGAENPTRGEIAKALKAIERYPKYISINKDLIETDYNLFDMTSKMDHFNNAHKRILEIQDYLKTVIQQCQDYADDDFWIKEIVEDCQECVLEMPIVPTSTSRTAILKYISKCKTYATKADRIFAVYDNLCKDYGVE